MPGVSLFSKNVTVLEQNPVLFLTTFTTCCIREGARSLSFRSTFIGNGSLFETEKISCSSVAGSFTLSETETALVVVFYYTFKH